MINDSLSGTQHHEPPSPIGNDHQSPSSCDDLRNGNNITMDDKRHPMVIYTQLDTTNRGTARDQCQALTRTGQRVESDKRNERLSSIANRLDVGRHWLRVSIEGEGADEISSNKKQREKKSDRNLWNQAKVFRNEFIGRRQLSCPLFSGTFHCPICHL